MNKENPKDFTIIIETMVWYTIYEYSILGIMAVVVRLMITPNVFVHHYHHTM